MSEVSQINPDRDLTDADGPALRVLLEEELKRRRLLGALGFTPEASADIARMVAERQQARQDGAL